MSRTCDLCGKNPGKGRTISHAQNKANRRFRPNLRRVRLPHGTNMKRQWVCTRCIKTQKKNRTATVPATSVVEAASQ